MGIRQTDVIVVGGGPTGLMLASELALGGVAVLVLERLAERSGQSKALNLQPRTAEVFDLRGLLERTREYALGNWGSGHFGGRPLSYEGWQTRHPYQVAIPQAGVERALEERLAEQGVPVLRGHDLLGFTQHDTGVTATVRTTAGELEVQARYLVGCDGGRSTVRKQLGVGFPGTDASQFAFVADVVFGVVPAAVPTRMRSVQDAIAREKTGRDKTGRRGTGGLIPLGEQGLHRLVFNDPDARQEDQATPVSADEVKAAIRRLYGEDGEIAEVRWASRFSNATRQADRYRVDRVLLAGDAAHIHFPAGGQGLNLGVQDAMNLGWKLAATVRGHAPTGLLDTYHAERHPVGARVLDNTRAQTLPTDPDPETRAMHGLITELARLPEANRYLAGMVSGLDIRYPVAGQDHPLLGARLPDLELPTHWTSTLFHSGHGVLLTTDPRHLTTAGPWSDRVHAVAVADLPLPATAVLARPDGYISWLALPETPHLSATDQLETALQTWFGPENP
ncbi:FAD-dependent monooxygenase [Actinokineospora cianjurensis]|uniref:2-polyprenyl-6-methoxyphenol hydroxylase-like FAD-dependent oxidoreductase n=1 Tax=Actinokineospora cianjurensis TaxID=585224 RepID=A0A421AV93_9PSEU|nr:FAD-dependent monooxygenase [Actinokineospora cianjurensis]RLK53928.1 2-polyprenyl-6-methoxyphenol hydroxylase-like FAD-dependent oxidoreductase [Actinokineospora cianjurensis]